MHRKRLLILHSAIVPYRLPLFTELAKSFDVTVWFARKEDPGRLWGTDIREEGFEYEILRSWAFHGVVFTGPLWQRLKRGKWDAILFADNFENLFSISEIIVFASLSGTPVLAWSEHVEMGPHAKQLYAAAVSRSDYLGYKLSKSIHNRIRKWWYKRASAVLSMSGPLSDAELEGVGVHADKRWTGTQVMPMDSSGLAGIREKRDLKARTRDSERGVVFLYLGYFRPEKNIESLLDAFMENARDADALVLAGAGPQERSLRARANSAPNVTFPGYVSGDEKRNLLLETDFLVLPSFIDPWGLVVNEALASGTPVICTTGCGAAALIHDNNGVVVSLESEGALSQLIRKLCCDEAFRWQYIEGAAQVSSVAQFTEPTFGVRHFLEALTATFERDSN
jgi:glycosyltransferase involved in cell wall biosynthesis